MSDLTIYTVAWICAIGTELVAAKQFLDETHDDADQLPANDDNAYVLGKVGKHNVVIAALPRGQYGLVSAAVVARDMARSFPNLRFALMVGIGGGAPSQKHDIRLGDIVVSSPGSGTGGVLQYDFGKTVQDESFKVTGHLNQSPQCLLRAIPLLKADYESDGNGIDTTIARILETKPRLRAKYRKPESSTDRLFSSAYKHTGNKDQKCTAICDATYLVERSERSDEEDSPTVHYGTIASANQLIKDANLRDKLSAEHNVLCFEMEAAGLMNQFPCIVVRGICDYSDTHKNKVWQGFAAMAAAAYAKDLLRKVAPNRIEAERRLTEVLSDVDSKLEIIGSQVKTTQTDIKSIRMDKHSEDIMQWLAPPDVSSNFNKAIKARHPGSGQRLLESKAYITWKTGDSSFLWLHGIPGCGKTILTSTVIEDLQKSQSHTQALLYFYFDFTDNRKQSLENTLRSLVWQIYHHNEVARKHLDSLYSSAYQNGKLQPSFDSLQKAFTEMIGNLGEVWIVLDALDECTPRGELLAWLRGVNHDLSVQVNLHVLVTSRPEQDIESAIKRYASDEQIIAIQNDLLETDIRNYVQARVREHEGLSRWRGHKEIQDKIEASLLEKANGMFRWVSCQLDALEDCLERKALLKALQDLPRTLDETYERILATIPQAHMHHARRILQFLIYSERPLRLDEAVDAIAVDIGKDVSRGRRFDRKDRWPVPKEIIGFCSSLVVLVSRQGKYGQEQDLTEIQLAHFSVRDYLTSDRLPSNTAQYLQETFARTSIAEVCLSYLLDLPQSGTAKHIREIFPFAQYSAQYWTSHAPIGEQQSDFVFELAKELLSSRTLLESWRRLYDPDKPWQVEPKSNDAAPALYYASLLGLPRCVRRLLDNEADVNAQGGEYGNALQAASYKGHQDIVRILVENGADVNAKCGEYGNTLYAASSRGYWEIVQILVDNGADINAQSGKYGNALQAASAKGYQEIVRILVENGADVNAQSGEYGNALYAASSRGHQEIVRLLVDNKADVNAQGGKYGNALYAASSKGYWETVQILVDNGADINAQSGEYGNALYAASSRGHQEIVQLLVDNKADVNAQGGKYGNALYAASSRGHQEIVQLLLDNNADVNTQGGVYGNALQAASSAGHREIVKLLLDNNADANAQDEVYGSALQAASYQKHQEIVQLLLDNNADVNTQGGVYGNALQAASSAGHREIVKLLLDNNADANAQGGHYGNALQAASYGGHQEIVQLLLNNKTHVNAQGGYYGNALQAASHRGHQEIVQIIVDNKADVNAQGGEYGNALQAASSRGHQEIVQILVDTGELQITETIIQTLAKLSKNGLKVMMMLLDRFGDQFPTTASIVTTIVRHFNAEVTQLLLYKKGDQVQITENVVQAAAENSQSGLEVMQLLFDYTQVPLSTKSVVLNSSALSGNVDVIKLLLDKDADWTIADKDGWTPLLNASYNGHIDVIKLLLKRDNNIDAADPQGHTALHFAAKNGNLTVANLLLSEGTGDINAVDDKHRTALLRASSAGHTAIVDLLLGMHADLMITDDCGTTCISVASRNGHLEVVQRLFGHGAEWSVQDDSGLDALQWAVWEGRHDVESFLLSIGAVILDDVYGFCFLFKDQW